MQKFASQIINQELTIQNDQDKKSLNFLKDLDVSKLVLKWANRVDFESIPDKVQHLNITGDFNLNGIQKLQLKTFIYKYEPQKQKENWNDKDEIINLNQIQTMERLQLCGFTALDFQSFQELNQLKCLNLSQNKLMKPSQINFQNLTRLEMVHSSLHDISFLESIQNLTEVSQNKIKNLDPLRNHKHLKYLDASDNEIKQLPKSLGTNLRLLKTMVNLNSQIWLITIQKIQNYLLNLQMYNYQI
ncbi:leucine-rich_repeat domain-containing protein [Hexamita inflata]|uniref:Leucine-rich repeat domain-containing protein n=1 Tax=Hexamita inflata TaxID=28002 RepID=A0AA86QZB9_9EUKA|nr:leucine-rich repeat domain-containing protein [Hexamita inflata]